MRKDILNDVEELGRVVCKIILQKYTSLWIDPSDILVLTAYLDHIFTDYPTGSKKKSWKWLKKNMPFVYFLLGNLWIFDPSLGML